MKVRFAIMLASIFFLTACEQDESSHIASMTMLLSNPERFSETKVSVVGFLGRGNDLYLTEEHSEVNDRSSSLMINVNDRYREDLGQSSCRGKYVEVIGVFGLVEKEGMASRIGIKQVESVRDQITKVQCASGAENG